MNEKWIKDEKGWIKTQDGKDICQYEGCGSHAAQWRSERDYRLALAAPEMYDLAIAMYSRGLLPPDLFGLAIELNNFIELGTERI